jgi:hypothetical protein
MPSNGSRSLDGMTAIRKLSTRNNPPGISKLTRALPPMATPLAVLKLSRPLTSRPRCALRCGSGRPVHGQSQDGFCRQFPRLEPWPRCSVAPKLETPARRLCQSTTTRSTPSACRAPHDLGQGSSFANHVPLSNKRISHNNPISFCF